MPDAPRDHDLSEEAAGLGRQASEQTARPSSRSNIDKVVCERCGADMFRMHAVWRCPACGYKTDCCGW